MAPPPLPLLTDLDRSADGSLDLSQHWFSGRFASAKLEEAYAAYTLVVWRPRLRSFFFFLSILEGCLLIKSLLCNCGLRFATYEGWALVYAFAFLMSSTTLTWLILSPRLMHITTRMMPWLIPVMVVLGLIGYVVPLGLYLDHAKPMDSLLLPEDPVALQLMKLALIDQGAWFTNSITTFTLLTALASVAFGVGANVIALFMPVAIISYLMFERKRFRHQYAIEPSLLPQSVVVYALCTLLTFCVTGSTRQQFIVRIYAQHERELRVEQLEQEKERLDYERLFALQIGNGNVNDGCCQFQQDQPQGQTTLRSASRSGPGAGLALNEGRGIGVPFGLSSASSSGFSDPELTGLGAAPASLTKPRVSAGCSSRARWLTPSHRPLPRLGDAGERSVASDDARSDQNAPSVASDSTTSTARSTAQLLSKERKEALSRTLDSVGVTFPPEHKIQGSSPCV